MSESEPSPFRPAGEQAAWSGGQNSVPYVAFDRSELQDIFTIYGHMVASGEWRDYAIDMMRDKAVFSIFRRTCERPLYRIEKTPALARRQGAYSVVAMTGLILKRGPKLSRVLGVLENRLHLVEA